MVHVQVDETRFTDVRRDEFGSCLDGIEKERKVSSCGRSKAILVGEDVSMNRRMVRTTWLYARRSGTHLVNVMMSVLGSSSDIFLRCGCRENACGMGTERSTNLRGLLCLICDR